MENEKLNSESASQPRGPGTTQLPHLQENMKANTIKFSAAELKELNDGLSKIQIAGARNAKPVMDAIGVEAPPKV